MDLLTRVAVTLVFLILLLVPVIFGYEAVRDFINPSRVLHTNPRSSVSPKQQVRDFRIMLVIVFATCLTLVWLAVSFVLIPVWTLPVV